MAARAILVTDVSDPQTWQIVRKEKPRASPGHAVVHITLRPINPTDFHSLRLKPPLDALAEKGGVVTGSEGVGYVEEVGEGVTKVRVGQRVVPSFMRLYYHVGNGSWQDYVEVPEDEILSISDAVSDEVAAQAIVNPWTVYGLLADLQVPKGEYVLQNAAGSVLGRQVIQLTKHWGIKTINVIRRDEIKNDLKSIGADEIINSTSEDVVARVKEITGGKGSYGAIDAVAGLQSKEMAKSVRDGGNVLVYGVLGSPQFDVTVNLLDLGRVTVKMWSGSRLANRLTSEEFHEKFAVIEKLLEKQVLTPSTGVTFKFEDFKDAIREAGKGGKVLISS